MQCAGSAEKLEVDDLQSEKAGKHDGSSMYAKDKRRMVALAERFSQRWQVCAHGSPFSETRALGMFSRDYSSGVAVVR